MAAKPRVLVLTPDYPPDPGGIQLLVYRLATCMSRLEPFVVAPGDEAAIAFDRSSAVPVHRVPPRLGGHRATVAALNAAALPVARRFKPDVILSAHIVASPAAAALRRHMGIPVVHYLLAKEAATRPGLAGFAVSRSDAVIAISRHTRQLGLHVGAKDETLHLITPGVDLPERHPRPRLDRPTILTVARLEDRYKGHDTIIHALPLIRAHVPDVQWIVAGDGKLRGPLEALAATYGVVDSVRFLGRVSDEERDAWLEQAHVFTMPSRVPGDGLGGEGFGIVYLEANWHELPVVAGDAGGAVDAVADGETGLLVDADNAVAVADALTRLLLDRELAARLGSQGAQRAKRFAWPLITEQVEDVLLSLVARA
jgi:phosphatidylinositol alpha-1,6-mannosyltransferase